MLGTFLLGIWDDTMVPKLVPVLFPCSHTIVSSPQIYDKSSRTKAPLTVYACTSMLGVMTSVYKTETSDLMMSMLKPWMDQFYTILEHPVQFKDPDGWSIRTGVLKCLNQFVQNFSSLTETEFKVVANGLNESHQGKVAGSTVW